MKTKFYMALPVILLALSLGGWALMISLAVDDPTFAVEEDYYRKAAQHDVHHEMVLVSERLGYEARVITFARQAGGPGLVLELALVDRLGQPVEGAVLEVEALANLRAADVQRVRLQERGTGLFVGTIPRAYPGIWELRVSASRAAEQFVQTLRAEAPGGSS